MRCNVALGTRASGKADVEAAADGAIDHYDGGCFAPLRAAAGSTDGLENVVPFFYKPGEPKQRQPRVPGTQLSRPPP